MKKLWLLFVAAFALLLCGCDLLSKEYTITFKNDDGTVLNEQHIKKDGKVEAPEIPSKEGYTFLGWYLNEEEWDFATNAVSDNIVLTARFEINQYTLTIKLNNGQEDIVKRQDYGTAIDSITEPTREGYTFSGWSETIPTKMPAENKTIEAVWSTNQYTLTLKLNDGSDDIVIKQDYGTAINVISKPTREGYTFSGWSETIPTKMPAENKTIEAQWTINKYTLTLKLGEGIDDIVINQDYDTSIGSVNNPARTGYTFIGWSETIPTKMPAENKTIEAMWTINKYTLTMKLGDGLDDVVITQDYDTEIVVNEPTKTGYSLSWSEEIPTKMPAENKTIEAIWTINKYKLTIKLNNGLDDVDITQDYDTAIDTISEPTKKGYKFVGWNKTFPTTMPAENIVVEALWECYVRFRYFSVDDNTIEIIGVNDKSIENLDILECYEGKSVIRIHDGAFFGCASLVSITIPDSVTSIGNSAFCNCTSLAGIAIPNSVTSIDSFAFKGCTSLTNITIPDSMTSIRDSVFSNCTSLTSVVIPESVKSVGDYAFENCPIKEASIPAIACATIKNASLEKVVITCGTSLDDGGLSNCTSLTSITIPDSITSIGVSAFSNCTSLTSIAIPDSVTSIGHSAFSDCTSLTSITFSKSVINMGGYVFYNCTSLASIEILGNVTEIANYTFVNCTSLESVILPNSVTKIGEYAFSNCSSLASINWPSSLISIGMRAFQNCSSLVNANLPDGIIDISNLAFYYCTSLKSVIIPESVTTIGGDYLFIGNSSIENVIVPARYCSYIKNLHNMKSVVITSGENISDSAFQNCDSLISIELPDSITSIGAKAFDGCRSLLSITIPSGVTTIGNDAFNSCVKLAKVINKSELLLTLGSTDNGKVAYYAKEIITEDQDSKITLTDDGFYLYEDTTDICLISYIGDKTDISIPKNVTKISDYAFQNCTSLANIIIPNNIISMGEAAFSGCTSLTSITIPNSIERIGAFAFSGCTSLASVTISNGVTNIGALAFSNCSALTNITIPKSIERIGESAFRDCYKLVEVINKANLELTVGSKDNGYVAYYAKQIITDEQDSKLTLTDEGFYLYNDGIDVYVVNYIGDSTDISIPNNATKINNDAFRECVSLTSIIIPNSITSIGDRALFNCTSLKSVIIPNSIDNLGNYTFMYCCTLSSIIIPASVTNIGSSVFFDCSSLIIYCEAQSKPDGWSSSWNPDNRPVEWGYTPSNV